MIHNSWQYLFDYGTRKALHLILLQCTIKSYYHFSVILSIKLGGICYCFSYYLIMIQIIHPMILLVLYFDRCWFDDDSVPTYNLNVRGANTATATDTLRVRYFYFYCNNHSYLVILLSPEWLFRYSITKMMMLRSVYLSFAFIYNNGSTCSSNFTGRVLFSRTFFNARHRAKRKNEEKVHCYNGNLHDTPLW